MRQQVKKHIEAWPKHSGRDAKRHTLLKEVVKVQSIRWITNHIPNNQSISTVIISNHRQINVEILTWKSQAGPKDT